MLLYDLGIFLFKFLLSVGSIFNKKAQQGLQGRKDALKQLKNDLSHLEGAVFIHCASLGEFEQGRPLIEQLSNENQKIVLSFFSPSGYEIRKNYSHADQVIYLPFDTKRNAINLLETLKPKAILIIKYDLWYHFLHQASLRKIPLFLISSSFKKEFAFFKSYGGLFRKMLRFFDKIYVQEAESKTLLESIHVDSTISGDTRIDRVLQIAKKAQSYPKVEAFTAQSHCLIAGSTWPKDEALLHLLSQKECFADWKMIIAPHDVGEAHIQSILSLFGHQAIRYTELKHQSHHQILIIDNIGMLSGIYRYGNLAYIGGGFGQGIHNILEPAAFNLPILTGPKIEKFPEAKELNQSGGARVIENENELTQAFEFFTKAENLAKAKQEISKYLNRNQGASEMVLKEVKKFV